jgi:Uma2 family endonuclease
MAITLKQPHPVTDDEILALSRYNPGYQFERSAKGELIVTPAGGKSSRCSGEVFGHLRDWNRTREGVVFDSSAGFRLSDGSLLSSDASWVARERWDQLAASEQEGFPPLCPDAVFEVASPSDGSAISTPRCRHI